MNAYVSNLWTALQGKTQESFEAEGSVSSGSGIILYIVFSLIPILFFAYGSAKLSWCLNQSYGWSFLCFLFPGFYYPYYAISLNPLCNSPMVGGKRR